MDAVTAQRTLVKSPPELWSEVSDAASLARHLGEFGEIRITRTEAETTVAWEGELASGTVELEPSGWGTRVTLTAEPVAVDPPPRESSSAAEEDLPAATGAEAATDAADPEEALLGKPAPARVPAPAPAAPVPPPAAPASAPAFPAVAPESEHGVGEPAAAVSESEVPEPEPAPGAPDPPPAAAAASCQPKPVSVTAEADAEGSDAPAPPRRGFWARLFRRTHPGPAPPSDADPAGDGAAEGPPDEASTAALPQTEQWDAIVSIAPAAAPADAAPPAQSDPAQPAPASTLAPATQAPPPPPSPAPAPAPVNTSDDGPIAMRPDAAPAAPGPSPVTPTAMDGQPAEAPSGTATVADSTATVADSTATVADSTATVADSTAAVADTEAVLAHALESLGAAHHRPFSRG